MDARAVPVELSPPEPAAVAQALKEAWRAGAAPDAVGALTEHSVLLAHPSLVVDLAYEEYCLREEAGAVPAVDAYCARFPAHVAQIREVIEGHRLLADHPELLAAPEWPHPGDRFEQLVVERELGRGTFARVYLARDPEAGGRRVVLKLAPGPSREARVLGGLTHPHIVPVLWARRSGGFDAVCMPFVGSTTLRDALTVAGATPGARFETVHRVALAARLAGAVEHLHGAGLIHGDLKPENVLVGPERHPYLIDFNLCNDLAAPAPRCGGTLPYMPPELLRVLTGAGAVPPTAAADVYSFGVVLFELLTGRVPAEPESAEPARAAAELLNKLATSPARPAAPAALAALVRRCLDPDPGRRPAMAQVRAALERHLARRARFYRVAVALGVVAASVAGTVIVTSPARRPAAAVPAAPAAFPVTADDHFACGLRYLKDGAVAPALKSFDDADRLNPSGQSAAHLALCHSLAGQHQAAVGLYQRAIGEHRFAPAWVRNNLSRALAQYRPTAANLRAAEAEAAEALALEPGLRSARLNRANARFRLALQTGREVRDDPDALTDVELALREPSDSAELYASAALMTVLLGGGREESLARAVTHLKSAVRLGRAPAPLAADPILHRHLRGRADFAELLATPPGPRPLRVPDPHLAFPPLD